MPVSRGTAKIFLAPGRGRARLAAGAGRDRRQQCSGVVAWPRCGRAAGGLGAAGVLTRTGAGAGAGLGAGCGAWVRGRVLCWAVCVRCAVSCACGRWECGGFWVRSVVRGVPCGVMGWLVWSWLFGVVWFTLATKLAMQKHPISVLYFCWLANPLAGRNRLSGAGHWTLGFPSFPRRPLI